MCICATFRPQFRFRLTTTTQPLGYTKFCATSSSRVTSPRTRGTISHVGSVGNAVPSVRGTDPAVVTGAEPLRAVGVKARAGDRQSSGPVSTIVIETRQLKPRQLDISDICPLSLNVSPAQSARSPTGRHGSRLHHWSTKADVRPHVGTHRRYIQSPAGPPSTRASCKSGFNIQLYRRGAKERRFSAPSCAMDPRGRLSWRRRAHMRSEFRGGLISRRGKHT